MTNDEVRIAVIGAMSGMLAGLPGGEERMAALVHYAMAAIKTIEHHAGADVAYDLLDEIMDNLAAADTRVLH